MVVTGGFRQRTQLENLEQGVDVLIATPGRFTYLMNEGILGLSNLRWYFKSFNKANFPH
jgi:ATP-dependent RNA helicase DDX18/HAS1